MATAAEKQASVIIRQTLNDGSRRFKYDEKVGNTYEKTFSYHNQDLKLLKFAQDEVGVVSDCFIMFAISILGVADLDSIRLFLSALSRRHKELSIIDTSEERRDFLRSRLQNLMSGGFLFKHSYAVDVVDDLGKPSEKGVSLYSITKDSQSLINQKLEKNTVIQAWIQAKPVYVLEGWGACSYVATRLAQNRGYMELKQGAFKTAAIGNSNLACVLKMAKKDDPRETVFVGFMYAYLHFNTTLQTEKDYTDLCDWLILRLRQFLFAQDKKGHMARIVMVVEDNSDLVELVRIITESGELVEDYDRIFFTGEGVFRKLPSNDTSFKNCFLRLKKARTKAGYDYIPVEPDFIS